MSATTTVHVRVDERVKARAQEALAAFGLSVSDAVRMFLIRVAIERRLPLAPEKPNAETRAAMAEADEMVRSQHARFRERH